MATAPTSLKHQMQKIAGRWAEDPFRPNVQLKTFLTSLAEHPGLAPAAVRAVRALENDEFKKKVSACSRLTGSVPQGVSLLNLGGSRRILVSFKVRVRILAEMRNEEAREEFLWVSSAWYSACLPSHAGSIFG